eukprot:1910171-Pleurochrysis_carterae.AAC.2
MPTVMSVSWCVDRNHLARRAVATSLDVEAWYHCRALLLLGIFSRPTYPSCRIPPVSGWANRVAAGEWIVVCRKSPDGQAGPIVLQKLAKCSVHIRLVGVQKVFTADWTLNVMRVVAGKVPLTPVHNDSCARIKLLRNEGSTSKTVRNPHAARQQTHQISCMRSSNNA